MQTHKNSSLRATSTVPAKEAPKNAPKATAPKFGAPTKKDPVLQLDGKKWMVSVDSLTYEELTLKSARSSIKMATRKLQLIQT